jgi:hypothetical protein
VLLADEDVLTGDALQRTVDELILLGREGDTSSIVKILDEFVPGAAVRCTPPPDITALY